MRLRMPQTVLDWKRAGRAAAVLGIALLSGCHQDMWNQPRLAALQETSFFGNTMGSRDYVAGTVAYEGARRKWTHRVFEAQSGQLNVPPLTDTTFYTGKTAGGYLPDNYFEVTRALLERGRERFEINCMPCHGLVGDGRGMIAQRGFPAPASYHTDRLREVEDGHIVDVISNGFGRMYSYAARVAPEDRWAIAAYIRALQASQNINITDQNSALAQLVKSGQAEQEQQRIEAAVQAEHATDHKDAEGAAASGAAH